jgi:nitrite reductase/ring-hydroxylating ferredoxin subunit
VAAESDRDHGTGTPGNRWLRRGFLAGLIAALGGLLIIAGRLLGHKPPAQKPRPARFRAAEVRSPARVLVRNGVALVKDGPRLIGLLLVCPHLGCRPQWHARLHLFVCPCHGSRFGLDGARRQGPAPRGLTRLQVIRLEDGGVRLDPTRPAGPGR